MDLVWEFFSTRSFPMALTSILRVRRQRDGEQFERFMVRAKEAIKVAEIATLTHHQIAILIHINLITDQ